jgi:hypothetical protein
MEKSSEKPSKAALAQPVEQRIRNCTEHDGQIENSRLVKFTIKPNRAFF